MAYIEKRNGSYRIRVSDGYDNVTCKRRFKEFTWTPPKGMSERQIKEELNRQAVLFEEKCRRGAILDDKITLKQFAKRWRSDYAEVSLKKTTLAHYDYLLERILDALGHIKLCGITPAHINAFYANLRECGMRINNKCRCKTNLRELLDEAKVVRKKLSEYSGVSLTTIEAAEKGEVISKDTAERLAETLNIGYGELFTSVYSDKPLSSKTLLHYHRLLNSIFEKAVKWNVLADNPCKHVEAPKLTKHEAKFLDEEQTRRLLTELETAPYQYRVMVNMLLFTGARRGEICGLRWSDVDFERKTIHIQNNSLYLPDYGMYEDTPKTQSSIRTVNIPQEVVDLLVEHRKHQEFDRRRFGDKWTENGMVFTQVNGKPIHPSTISAWLRKFCKQRGLPHINPHMLRHTSATLLLMQGLPLKAVSGRLGHAQTSTTSDIYGHCLQSVDEIAANALGEILKKKDEENK
ncbi:MAG: tyrosine-type recombinase/integrase [Oscillospiraceae bacterium]|nr:tyrosine-type recombinase/integrase [Oscillospiraceae bacterium]